MSKVSKISEAGWWIVDATVFPVAASSFSVAITCAAVNASRPLVGSSTKRRLGFVTSSAPMLVRFRSPPEIPPLSGVPTTVSAAFSRWSTRMIASTTLARAAAESEFGSRSAALNCSTSRGVCVSSIRSSCVTNATTRRNASRSRTAWPFTVTSPRVAPRLARPDSTLSSVVFPAPLDPMIASTSPGEAWPDTPERICFVDFFLSFTSYDSDRQLNCSFCFGLSTVVCARSSDARRVVVDKLVPPGSVIVAACVRKRRAEKLRRALQCAHRL